MYVELGLAMSGPQIPPPSEGKFLGKRFRQNPNNFLGVEREFAPIERLEDTAEGIWSSFQGESVRLIV